MNSDITKKQVLRSTFDFSASGEGGIKDFAHFEQFLQKRIKFIEKAPHLAKDI